MASQVVSTGEWRYHHYDGQGNCILLTDISGAIREQYDYDAFGMPYVYSVGGVTLGAAAQWGNRFLFTGREWLSDLRIYDYRARQYQPELGRFLQPDPKEFSAGDYNLYRYCHNDPVNKSDPTGLKDDERFQEDFQWKAAAHFDSANKGQGLFQVRVSEPGRVYGEGPPGAARGKVNWSETGERNIPREYVRSDDGKEDLDARTYSELRISASSDAYGKLDTLNVVVNQDVEYASMKNGKALTPDQLASTRRKEPDHYNEIHAWGLDEGRDIARSIARQYSGRSAIGAVHAAETALRPKFEQAVKDSHNAHDLPWHDHRFYDRPR
jgi:RHS repeat-associated protein